MPYIKQAERSNILWLDTPVDDVLDEVIDATAPETAGQLNFAFTSLILAYLRTNGVVYQTFNDIIGALEGAKLELYRRMIVPYEVKKIEENGDVYPG